MEEVTTRDAQHHLSKVLAKVAKGKEVLITRRGRAVAKLSAYAQENPLEKTINWSRTLKRIDTRLAELPHLADKNISEDLRTDERY